MGYTLADLTSWAQQASGKEDDPSVSNDRWRVLIDAGIKATFKKVAAQFGDSWIATTDFTLTSAANSVVMPSNFEHLRHVSKDPTLSGRRRIEAFNLNAIDDYDGPRYRVMGRTIFMEPPENAAGNFRAWYVPRPMQFTGDFTVRVTCVSSIGAYAVAGAGPGKTLTKSGNGAFNAPAADGVTVVVGDRVLVPDVATIGQPVNAGIYTVVSPGVAGVSPWVLARATDYDEALPSEVRTGTIIRATEGATLVNVPYVLGTFVGPVDVGSQLYTVAVLDPTLDPYAELIVYYAAAAALEGEKSDSSQQRGHILELVADLEVMADSQEAGGQTAIYDVEEFDDPRLRRRPLP